MPKHQLAEELATILNSLYEEIPGTQIRIKIDRAIQLLADLDEIITNLNQIAHDAFDAETHDCAHCGSNHDHPHERISG